MRPFLLFVLFSAVNGDDYIDEVQGRCYATNKTLSCAKYKIFKYIDDYSLENVSLTSGSSVQFVQISGANDSDIAVPRKSRQYVPLDSEVTKIFKFLKRKFFKFTQEQGVQVELPEGARIVDGAGESTERAKVSARGKKKKAAIILPILILLKLCKVKIMMALALAGIVFIKKSIIAAAFILPGVVAAIKLHCKAQQHYQVVPYHEHEEHYTHEHEHEPSGFGVSGYGTGDKHHWDKRRKYSYN